MILSLSVAKKLPPIAVISIPKSGTHLLTGFLELLGYRHGGLLGLNPTAGYWYSLSVVNTHTTTDFLKDMQPYHPITEVPIIFIYRNPLDVVVSDASYMAKDGNSIFWSFYAELTLEERIYSLIDDPWLLGSIRDRLGSYLGWMHLGNVIPVSFEELVGQRGGGSDSIQAETISSILGKLNIGMDPDEIGARIFNEASPTFRVGRIGSHLTAFSERCYRKFADLPQDFMLEMGYKPVVVSENGVLAVEHDVLYSSRIAEFRKRPLMLSKAKAGEVPHLIESDVFGHNLVLYRKCYYAVPQADGEVDFQKMTEHDLASLCSSGNLDILRILVMNQYNEVKTNHAEMSPVPPDGLVLEDFYGFNIVRFRSKYYGLDQSIGAVDMEKLDKDSIDELRRSRVCLMGNSLEDVEENILNLVKMQSDLAQFKAGLKENVTIADGLFKEGFEGFNIVRWQGNWYGFDQSAGPIELESLTPSLLDQLRARRMCFIDHSLESIEASILKLVEDRKFALAGDGQRKKISLLMPTRGRPAWVERFFNSVVKFSADVGQVEVILYVDDDDTDSHYLNSTEVSVCRIIGPRMSMGGYNAACLAKASGDIIILVNDDMVIQTPGWDEIVIEFDNGIPDKIYLAYGNDLFKKGGLCTFPILSRRVCEILIEPYPKEYQGAFIDYHLFDIFKRLMQAGYDRVCYMDDLVFEHLHYRTGKAPMDEIYKKRGRFSDDPTFLALIDSRKKAAARLQEILKGEKHQSLYRPEPGAAESLPDSFFKAVRALTRDILFDKGLPIRWRSYLWVWFIGRYLASHGFLWPLVKKQ